MREVVIVGYARTPFGSFQGTLSQVSAPKLGSIAIEGALKKAGVNPSDVNEVIMGMVLPAGVGQAPARQAALGAGIPQNVPCLTINKVCGSGMKSIMLGMQSILLGESEVVVAGGMENMSQAPFLLKEARGGYKMGNQSLIDSMVSDGLWDPYNNQHMGNCAELCAREKNFSREAQDEFAMNSFKRSQKAWTDGKFKEEVVPVIIPSKKGNTVIDQDEGPFKAQFDKIPTLKPVFDKNGSVTAANASTINDGAAAMVLMSADKAKSLGLKPIAKLKSTGTFAQDPVWFTTAPAPAMESAIHKAGWKISDVDLFEVNEAFAVVALAAEKDLSISRDRLNIFGGAISLGHPIGASGARIVGTLMTALRDQNKKRGVAGICIGGGEATAIALEVI